MYQGEFSSALKAIRVERGLKLRDVADAAGMTLRAYQRYEAGEREPDIKGLVSLADFFGVSLDELCGDNRMTKEVNAMDFKLSDVRCVVEVGGTFMTNRYLKAGWILLDKTGDGEGFIYSLGWTSESEDPVHPSDQADNLIL